MILQKTGTEKFPNKSRRFHSQIIHVHAPEGTESSMKELLCQMAAYNTWANQKILEIILTLPEEKQKQELPSSFKSLYDTVLHMWNAESAWWQRMKLQERIQAPSEYFKGSFVELSASLAQQNYLWQDWVDQATDAALEHVFQYQNNKKEQFKQPIFQMLLHVFNHGTYHRGQLINMLRQLGIEKLPQTDFIVWSRKK